MKRIIIIFAVAAAILPWTSASAATDLRGRILLQVESKGQAWYVLPENGKRAFLGHPTDAFNIMRELGLGITNANINKIPIIGQGQMNTAYVKKLAGRILLQVESHGEAWYVSPVTLKRYYLGRPADAFRIMRELGLGITNANLGKIAVDSRYPEVVEPVSAKTYDVVAYRFEFSPKNLTIRLGDSVHWVNQDPATHTITPVGSTLTGFGSGTLMPSQYYTFKFTKRGTFNYKCSLHPYMTGSIVVK
ncbi:hypothetical protein HGA34_00050 [Candidatus Falkowbacteria bacterium]|nr:hypothetical protein [Candidatus Falkowbacteria bacterium]